jgi:hypothetical protein
VRPGSQPNPSPAPVPDSIDFTLILIGDTGKPRLEAPEPVLDVLEREAAAAPDRTMIVFMGDNIYPDGLPPTDHEDRERAEQVLRVQVDTVKRSGARAIFAPGNHDYHGGGQAAVQRQERFFVDLSEPRVEFLPRGGCPGPEVIDLGNSLRLIVLDTEYWIEELFPQIPSECPVANEEDVLAGVRDALESKGERHAVVVGHHPLETKGWHGGNFDWRDHLFPLSRMNGWLWIPLPVVGSLYPVYRMQGGYPGDVSSTQYKHMVRVLDETYAPNPPLIHAGGHDHNLQVFAGPPSTPHILVSGSGTVARPDPVWYGEDTLLASPFAGFMRVDALRDGRVRLEVIEVDEEGGVRRLWSTWLTYSDEHSSQR